jgi:hypothetical protein
LSLSTRTRSSISIGASERDKSDMSPLSSSPSAPQKEETFFIVGNCAQKKQESTTTQHAREKAAPV